MHSLPGKEQGYSDKGNIDCVAHYHMDFIDSVYPIQHHVPTQLFDLTSETEQRVIDAEITKLLAKWGYESSIYP